VSKPEIAVQLSSIHQALGADLDGSLVKLAGIAQSYGWLDSTW
jgi:hypothetical protein